LKPLSRHEGLHVWEKCPPGSTRKMDAEAARQKAHKVKVRAPEIKL